MKNTGRKLRIKWLLRIILLVLLLAINNFKKKRQIYGWPTFL